MNDAAHTLCIGEALVDVVLRNGQDPVEHVGGSLFNVACGLARLGRPTSVLSWWSDDERGARITDAARAAGLAIADGTVGAASTPVAYAQMDDEGRATYEFDLTWEIPTAPDAASYGHVHTGSFAATLAPGGDAVLDAVRAAGGTVSYDPNIRPALMGSPAEVRGRIEQLVTLSDVVKASDEDIAWLYPNEDPHEVLARWCSQGPALVVLTRGPDGADAVGQFDGTLHIDTPPVTVADTVGAGDSFMAGLISSLLDAGVLGSKGAATALREEHALAALQRAVATSGITVTHAGAYAPTLDEVKGKRAG